MLAGAIDNARLGKIVGRHFNLHRVAFRDADPVFAHLTGNMRQYFMSVGQLDLEHSAGHHL